MQVFTHTRTSYIFKFFTVIICLFVLGLSAITFVTDADESRRTKYVFFMIGDGMGLAQRNSAEVYKGAISDPSKPSVGKLVMSTFPTQGMSATYSESSIITDSAAAGTALACGFKTTNGVISMDSSFKHSFTTIAEMAKKKGMKVGIISSVSIDHATPACFYSHQSNRGRYYEIGMQLARSDFDYFAGGGFRQPKGPNGQNPSIIEAAQENGFTYVQTREELEALTPESGKVLAINHTLGDGDALFYELDRPDDHISLAEFTRKGIELLDNNEGFFMMVEGGKIDWACHANDAASAINDVLAFDAAVKEAFTFYQKHPGETIIVVTGDHECGGMTIGFAGTKYSTFFEKISHQKKSYVLFNAEFQKYKTEQGENHNFEKIKPLITEYFGLIFPDDINLVALVEKAKNNYPEAKALAGMVLTSHELQQIKTAYERSMQGERERAQNDFTYLMYGSYEPLTVNLTHLLNQKAGIGWTSYSHTGIPVPVMAIGNSNEIFNGYYDNTELAQKLMSLIGCEPHAVEIKNEKKEMTTIGAGS